MAPKGSTPSSKKTVKKVEKAVKTLVREEEKKQKRKVRVQRHQLSALTTRENGTQMKKRLARVEKKLKKQNKIYNGPKPQDSMKVTATIGVVTGNQTDALVRKHKLFVNPLLLKIDNSGQTTTPLSERASMYQLYKIQHLDVKFIPLVNASNVSGTLVLADVDQQGNAAKPETVDTIKARMHREVPIGRFQKFQLPKRTLAGPRQGWWGIDPNEDAEQTFGPAISVWTYLATKNLLSTSSGQTNIYDGPLFLVEVNVTYFFTNYGPKPALSMLQNETTTAGNGDVSFKTDQDGDLVMSIKNGTVDSKNRTLFSALSASPHQEQTFWSVTSDAIETVSPFLGPWSWLLKAGWWVIKKIAGQNASDTTEYKVYASVEDAQRNNPVKAQVQAGNKEIPGGEWHIQQLNTPNIDLYQQPSAVRSEIPNQSRPTGFSPQSVNIPVGWQNGNKLAPFETEEDMVGNTVLLLTKTSWKQYPVYQFSLDDDYLQVQGVQNNFRLKLTDYTPTGSPPTAAKRHVVMFKLTGQGLFFGGARSKMLGLISSTTDWDISNLPKIGVAIQQVKTTFSGSNDKPISLRYNGQWKTQWENEMLAAGDIQKGDLVYVVMMRNQNLLPPDDVTGKLATNALMLYNSTKKTLIVVGVGLSPTYLPSAARQYMLYTVAGVVRNNSIFWDNENLPEVNSALSIFELQEMQERMVQDVNEVIEDDSDVESCVSGMFEKFTVDDEKEYWRRTAQQLMLEKTSRQNTFPSSSGR